MNKNDKNYYRLKDDIEWASRKTYNRIIYRTWWMVAVNIFLKILQPFTQDPFLVNAESEMDDDGNPHFIRYCLGKIKALASVVLNDQLQVQGLRVMYGQYGLFVGYPADPFFKGEETRYVCAPITRQLREHIENCVLEKYQQVAG